MTRKFLFLLLLTLLLTVPTKAQDNVNGWTTTELNLRAGPGTNYTILAKLPAATGLVFEGRSADSAWLLGHTQDSGFRGWMTGQYLRYQEGFDVANLPVSAEVIGAGQAAPPSGDANAWTNYSLNLRTGPGAAYSSFGLLPASTPLVVEAHNADLSWLLVHTGDLSRRGWVASLYLHYQPGFAAAGLPTSNEIITVSTTAPASAAQPEQNTSSTDAAQQLLSIPILPSISARMRAIFQGSGNEPQTFIKIGDCNSEYWEFLGPLDNGSYDLGPYGNLQSTIDFFKGSWAGQSMTAHGGFTVLSVLDPTWSNNPQCQWNETPLNCELRLRRPSVAVMMFGPNDVFHLTTEQFEAALRQVVQTTIDQGTIPVLTTFTWCRTDEYNEKGLQFNLAAVRVARDYDIPLINFWRAAQGLPRCGLLDDTHLSKPVMTTTGNFNGEEQRTGHTLRNLLTVQTLDAIRTSALQ